MFRGPFIPAYVPVGLTLPLVAVGGYLASDSKLGRAWKRRSQCPRSADQERLTDRTD